jgi:hypothetical protein
MTTSFKLDTREVDRVLASLGSTMPRVITQALNRTIRGVKTVMKREVSKDIGIKVGVVAEGMKITKANVGRPQATLTVRGKRIPLIKLGAKGKEPSRGKGRGVTYRLGGKRRRIPSAFIATMPSGHRGVFKRVRRMRLPITELHGPSIVHVFQKHFGKGRARAAEQLPKEIGSAIRKAASKGAS